MVLTAFTHSNLSKTYVEVELMRSLDESREILYVIRTLDVLMSSGVGLEAAIHSIAQGGYGIISKDFEGLIKNLIHKF